MSTLQEQTGGSPVLYVEHGTATLKTDALRDYVKQNPGSVRVAGGSFRFKHDIEAAGDASPQPCDEAEVARAVDKTRGWRERKLNPAHASAGPTPAPQSTPAPDGPASAPSPTQTSGSLLEFAAMLLHPVTKAGAQKLPLYYLIIPPMRLRPAPPSAPFADKMRRRCEVAAIALWWPIARLLTLWRVWQQPPPRRAVLDMWPRPVIARENRKPATAQTGSSEPCATPVQAPAASTRVSSGEAGKAAGDVNAGGAL